jgi:serine/threonine protein kinase
VESPVLSPAASTSRPGLHQIQARNYTVFLITIVFPFSRNHSLLIMASRLPLQTGYVLKGYTVGEVLGGGGFSLVYLASNEIDRHKFVIKEYCPQDLVARKPDGSLEPDAPLSQTPFRNGLEKFRFEAERMSAVRHPNVISVAEYFEANNTLYMVMTHEEGRDLRWFINKLAGDLDWGFLQQVFPPIGDGLWRMHQQGVVHLDVKPANVLLRTSGQPLLLDFGAAQTMDNDDRFGSFQTLTHGFAPPEQYLDGNLGPWTDIYGLAATIYNCITGNSPPPALKRRDGASLEKLTVSRSGTYPYTLLKAVEDALSLDQGQRPHDMHAFLSLAFGASSHIPVRP